MAITQSNFDVVLLSSNGDLLVGPKLIRAMRWIADTSGDDLRVTDAASNIIWEAVADTDNFTDVMFFGPTAFNGVKAAVIDSGTLFVYKA